MPRSAPVKPCEPAGGGGSQSGVHFAAVVVPLDSTLVMPHWESCAQSWAPQPKEDSGGRSRRATRMTENPETKPWGDLGAFILPGGESQLQRALQKRSGPVLPGPRGPGDQSQEGGSGRGQEDLPARLNRWPMNEAAGHRPERLWMETGVRTQALPFLPSLCQKVWMLLCCFCPKQLIFFPNVGENRPASPVLTGAERPGPDNSCTQPKAHHGKTWVKRAQCRTVFLGLLANGHSPGAA